MDVLRGGKTVPIRLAMLMIVGLTFSTCGPSVRAVRSAGEAPQPYMLFSIIVDRESGSLGPAQKEADRMCSDVLQSAVMYLAADVGEHQTRYYFRCR